MTSLWKMEPSFLKPNKESAMSLSSWPSAVIIMTRLIFDLQHCLDLPSGVFLLFSLWMPLIYQFIIIYPSQIAKHSQTLNCQALRIEQAGTAGFLHVSPIPGQPPVWRPFWASRAPSSSPWTSPRTRTRQTELGLEASCFARIWL